MPPTQYVTQWNATDEIRHESPYHPPHSVQKHLVKIGRRKKKYNNYPCYDDNLFHFIFCIHSPFSLHEPDLSYLLPILPQNDFPLLKGDIPVPPHHINLFLSGFHDWYGNLSFPRRPGRKEILSHKKGSHRFLLRRALFLQQIPLLCRPCGINS